MIHDAASLARNTARLAMSSGSPRRSSRHGWRPGGRRSSRPGTRRSRSSPGPGRCRRRGVGASSAASWRVRWISAALVRLYVPRTASARMPPTDAMLTITPGLLAHGARFHADWHQNTGPADVDLERLVEAGRVDAHRRAGVRVGGGVVDEDVEPSEALDAWRHAGVGRLDVAGVGGEHGGVATDLTAAASRGPRSCATTASPWRRTRRSRRRWPCRSPSTRRDERDLAVESDLHGGGTVLATLPP